MIFSIQEFVRVRTDVEFVRNFGASGYFSHMIHRVWHSIVLLFNRCLTKKNVVFNFFREIKYILWLSE